jgi:hypothetical protein
MTGISFTTSPVVEFEKLDKLMTEARITWEKGCCFGRR